MLFGNVCQGAFLFLDFGFFILNRNGVSHGGRFGRNAVETLPEFFLDVPPDQSAGVWLILVCSVFPIMRKSFSVSKSSPKVLINNFSPTFHQSRWFALVSGCNAYASGWRKSNPIRAGRRLFSPRRRKSI